jgi:hypothetical protein
VIGVEHLGRNQRHLQLLDHGAVFGAADDAPQRQRGGEVGGAFDQMLESHGRRHGVGVGIVVHVDEQVAPALQLSRPLPRLKSAMPRSDCAPVRGSGVNSPLFEEGNSSEDGIFLASHG